MDDQPPMQGVGKGKGKAKDGDQEVDGHDEPRGASLMSRIAESASGLLRDTAAASHADVSNTLSFSSELGTKNISTGSSSARSNWEDHGIRQRAYHTNTTSSLSQSNLAETSLRTLPQPSNISEEFAQFASEDSLNLGSSNHTMSRADDFGSIFQTSVPPAVEPQYDDGAEVRALLSDPTFFKQMNDMHQSLPSYDSQNIAQHKFSERLSAQQQNAINELRKTLPPPPVHKPMPDDHPLNLRPRSEGEKQFIEENIDSILAGTETLATPDMQTQEWLTEWSTVLNSYNDEVWGDMLPVVQETKELLQEVKAGNASVDEKAKARLKMILGHLQQNSL